MSAAADAALTLPTASAGFAVAALAGVLRGFSGFGFALVAVPALTLFLPPAEVVPCILLLQVAAGLQLLPKTRHLVDWPSLVPLLGGALAGTPLGVLLLGRLPTDVMRAVIGIVLLGAVMVLGRGVTLRRRPVLAVRLGIGLLSGLLNGGTAMSGPPAVVYFLATSRSVAIGRASLLMYFLVLSVAGVASTAAAGLVGERTLWLAALMFPALLAGNALGDRLFDRSAPELYRRIALAVLAAIALLALLRALAP